MTIPTEVTFRDIEPSDALRALVVERAQRLAHFAPDIIDCHVTIEHAGARHRQGNPFNIHARVSLPGKHLDVRGHSKSKAHQEDAYALVGDTFDALRRRIEDYVRVRRGEVKLPPTRSRDVVP